MIKLQNNTRTTFVHGIYKLEPQGVLDVPNDVAKIWMQNDGVIEYVAPADAKAEKAKYEAEIEKLKAQLEEQTALNEKLQAEFEAFKKAAELEALKKEADALGVEYPANIGAAKLQERINAKKTEQK